MIEGSARQAGRVPMLQDAMQDPDLAVTSSAEPSGSLQASSDYAVIDMILKTLKDSGKGDLTPGQRTVGVEALQAVPPALAPSGRGNSATLESVQGQRGSAVEMASEAPSGRERKRGHVRSLDTCNPISDDPSRLLGQWRTMANRGDTNAQFNLGCAYLVGWGVGRDAATAASWFEAAAERGDVNAQFNLGVIHAAGDGVQRDLQTASRWFKMAANQGYPEAQFNLASMYENGEGIGRDMNESIKWYQLAAQNGHSKSQFNLGVILSTGVEGEINIHKAIPLYEQAFANGVAQAAYNLGVIYDTTSEAQKCSQKAVKWYTRAAEQGVAIAQHNLATCICMDTNTLENQKLAFKWFHAAAGQGVMLSQHNLAVFYDRGIGVNRNVDKALYWYKIAANQGFPHSQYLLGAKYAKGEGLDEDKVEAFVWIRYAAEQGHPDSQCLLASMYYQGVGVFVDYPEAYKWVTLGLNNCASQSNMCVQLRNDIAQKLHHDQLKRSEQSVIDWSPRSWAQLKPSGYSIKHNNSSKEPIYRIIGPIKFVNKLLVMWEIDQENAVSLLGFDKHNKGYVDKLLQGNEYLVEGSETEDRIAYLFYIWSVLSELLRDRAVEVKWLKTAEREFEGKTPMDLILSGSITNLLLVKEFVDFISGRSGAC